MSFVKFGEISVKFHEISKKTFSTATFFGVTKLG
jgi:hypothetical protein